MWDRFIDLVTVVWLGIFALGLAAPQGWESDVLLYVIPVYVVDLGVKYRRVGNVRRFVREHWLTILMVIPYLRVLRLLRVLRVLRVARAGRVLRSSGAWRRLRRLWSRLWGRPAGPPQISG